MNSEKENKYKLIIETSSPSGVTDFEVRTSEIRQPLIDDGIAYFQDRTIGINLNYLVSYRFEEV